MEITVTRKRPEHKLSEVLADSPTPKTFNKRFTTMKAAKSDTDSGSSALSRPTDEELAKINQFTQSTKTADDVVVLHTMSANDMRDRDLDKFKTACIKKFAALPQPYSPIGKSFMVGHDTSKLPQGRIFDTGTQRVEDTLYLTNSVYMPNTAQNADYLESVDFGIFWAVSVGVMIGSTECTVGKSHEYSGRWWCSQGHEKGLYYDPNNKETDDWGWPEPVKETDKGAVLCACDFDDPTDFYELSQVYLGAQYFAELGKSAGLEGVIKSASRSIPIIGLSHKEADAIPMQHTPDQVVEARMDFTVLPTNDGSTRWKDDKNLVYTFDPGSGKILCLGTSDEVPDEEVPVVVPEVTDDPELEVEAEVVDDDTEKGAVEPMSKKAIQVAARTAKLPSAVLDILAGADEDKALDIVFAATAELVGNLEKKIKDDEPMVTAGAAYIEDIRTAVKVAYVRAKQTGTQKGVDTTQIEKLIVLAGADTDLLKSLQDEYENEVKGKLPEPVSRSSFPVDPEKPLLQSAPNQVDPSTNGHVKDPEKVTLATRIHR